MEKAPTTHSRPPGTWIGLAVFGLLGGFLSQSLWQGISVAWAAQQPGSSLLEVREVRLVDEEGVLWGRLGQSPRADGQRGLILYDEQGRERGRLALSPGGHGGLVLSSQGSAYRVGLTLSRTGIPALSLTDQQGRIRSLLLVDEKGPQVDLYSETSDIVLGLEAAGDGPRVRLREAGGQDWVAAVLSPSSLGFRANSRSSGVTVGLDEQKSPRLVLVEEGKPVASLPRSPQE